MADQFAKAREARQNLQKVRYAQIQEAYRTVQSIRKTARLLHVSTSQVQSALHAGRTESSEQLSLFASD